MSIRGKIKQRYNRIRKRNFFSFVIAFVAIFTLAALILLWAGIFGSRSELCTIKVSQDTSSVQTLQGLGINLDYIPINNLVKNSSFESEKIYDTFVISDSSSDALLMSSEEVESLSFSESELIGCKARIYTIDENGVMSLVSETEIIDFINASFGTLEEINDTNWYWTKDEPVEIVCFQNVLTAITENGNLIADMSSESFSKLIENENSRFVGIAASNSTVVAVTDKGEFYFSNDGKNFLKKTSLESSNEIWNLLNDNEISISDLCVLGDEAIALLSDGTLLLSSENDVIRLDIFDSKVVSISSTKDYVVVALGNGRVFKSSNSYVFVEETEVSNQIGTALIKELVSSSTGSAVLLSDNRVLIMGDSFELLSVPAKTRMIRLLEDGSILGILENGSVFYSNKTNTSGLTNTDIAFDCIYSGDNDHIILTNGSSVYETSVYMGVRLSGSVPQNAIYAGDICSIEKNVAMCQGYVYLEADSSDEAWSLSGDLMSWDIYGNGTSVTVVDDAPSGLGVKSARILGSGDSYHVLSQKLADCGNEIFIEKAFFRIEMYMRQLNLENDLIKIWLSSEGCNDIGFVVDNCSSRFGRYDNVFTISDEMLNSENEIRLNIAFEGTGELRVDGVYLGLDKYSETGIPSEFSSAIVDASPNVIRLNNINFGSSGVSYESVFSLSENSNASYASDSNNLINNCHSLEDSLKLVKNSGATPWLVIGSRADQISIDYLLEYMCGSVNSTYGKKRIDNGTAVPWSRQFDKLIIEINDTDSIFPTDVQRSAYVNYIIGLFRQSAYYKDVKDKVMFLDGMNYDGGVMLSFADYHAISYVDDGVFDSNITYLTKTNKMYRDINNLAPRVKSQLGQNGEFISSLDILGGFGESPISLADCVVSLLAEESSFANIILVDLNIDSEIVDYNKLIDTNVLTMLRCMKCLDFIYYSQKLDFDIAKPLAEKPQVTLEQFESQVGVYYIKTGNDYYLVIANSSSEQAQFAIDGVDDLVMAGSLARRYSATGEELESEKISKQKNRYTLMEGQVLVIEIANEE